jgi:hypothetical protein
MQETNLQSKREVRKKKKRKKRKEKAQYVSKELSRKYSLIHNIFCYILFRVIKNTNASWRSTLR